MLVVGLAAPFALTPAHLPLDVDASANLGHVYWGSFPSNRSEPTPSDAVHTFAAAEPLVLPPCNYSDFALFHVAPIFEVASALKGRALLVALAMMAVAACCCGRLTVSASSDGVAAAHELP